eukprot:4319959-Pleurochrysis_carterae.AAC.1
MIRRPPRSTQGVSSAALDVYKRQALARTPHAASNAKTLAPTIATARHTRTHYTSRRRARIASASVASLSCAPSFMF